MMAEIMGKYIYGIINAERGKVFVPGQIARHEGIYAISHNGISAVVSEKEMLDWTSMLKDRLARELIRHQQVIEGIMTQGWTIIPMKLGTYALTEEEVKNILKLASKITGNIFKKIARRIEIDLAVTWSDFAATLKEIGEKEEIKKFRQALLNKKEGITVEEQMMVGAMVKKALEERREMYAHKIQTSLSKISEDIKAHELMDDKMVANVAFLINKARQEVFDKKVEELDSEFTQSLNFRCVGPLPPYSFYTLEVKKLPIEEISRAKKKLGLNNFTDIGEIKKAYYQLANSSHPDKNPHLPGREREFVEINNAYKTLLDYCQAREQAGEAENYPFKEERFKKVLLVKIKLN